MTSITAEPTPENAQPVEAAKTTADQTLDARGLKCPMPVVRTSQAIKKLPVSGVLELLATDAGSVADVVAWCKGTGNELIDRTKEGDVFKFYIRRLK